MGETEQIALFAGCSGDPDAGPDRHGRLRRPPFALPVIGEQKDISYHGATARGILNGPATTGMDFWSINPYVGCAFGCAYCYARYAHRYVMERVGEAPLVKTSEMPAWLAFERRILVKENAAALLRQALARGGPRGLPHPVLRGAPVAIGTATDPYQPAERRFRVTRAVLEVLAEHEAGGFDVSITTKSPLVTRDIDLLQRIARRSSMTVHVSLITVDRELARRIEPRAPTPESRLRAIARLRAAGIDVGVFVMPVLPGLTDAPAQLDALLRAIADSGATWIGACALRLRSTARQRYLPFLAEEFPALAPRYRAAYARSHQVSERYREGLRSLLRRLCAKHGVAYGHEEEAEEEATVSASPQGELALADGR